MPFVIGRNTKKYRSGKQNIENRPGSSIFLINLGSGGRVESANVISNSHANIELANIKISFLLCWLS